MAGHPGHSHRERAIFAMRRPDLLWRKICGRDLIKISLDEIAPYLPTDPVILEAGACDGTDTERFVQRWPDAVIYAFEPLPELYAEVQRRTANLPGVHLYPLALSGRAGPAILHATDPGRRGRNEGPARRYGSGSSLLVPVPAFLEDYGRTVKVNTETIADWAQAQGVDRIDFMWLDMQGMELAALKAARPVLDTVRAVHMEVSREEGYVGAPLHHEIVAWMKDEGFRSAIDRVTLWFGNILFVRDYS